MERQQIDREKVQFIDNVIAFLISYLPDMPVIIEDFLVDGQKPWVTCSIENKIDFTDIFIYQTWGL
jgi:hypothetical protein